MARIYVSSSWKNEYQPILVEELRKRGHEVYDFRHPDGRNDRNVWETVSEKVGLSEKYVNNTLSPNDFKEMASTEEAEMRFCDHFCAMMQADTCILLLPCGRSSHAEAGFMRGLGNSVFVMDTSNEVIPELMYLMFDGYFSNLEELCTAIEDRNLGIKDNIVAEECHITHKDKSWINVKDDLPYMHPELISTGDNAGFQTIPVVVICKGGYCTIDFMEVYIKGGWIWYFNTDVVYWHPITQLPKRCRYNLSYIKFK